MSTQSGSPSASAFNGGSAAGFTSTVSRRAAQAKPALRRVDENALLFDPGIAARTAEFRQALMQKCVEPLSGVFRARDYRHQAVCFSRSAFCIHRHEKYARYRQNRKIQRSVASMASCAIAGCIVMWYITMFAMTGARSASARTT